MNARNPVNSASVKKLGSNLVQILSLSKRLDIKNAIQQYRPQNHTNYQLLTKSHLEAVSTAPAV